MAGSLQLLRFLHLVGIVLLVGGGIAAGVANRVALQSDGDARALDVVQYELTRLGHAGAVFVFGSGLAAAHAGGFDRELSHHLWLVLMFGFALGAVAVHGIAGARLKRLLAGGASPEQARAVRRGIAWLRVAFVVFAVGALVMGVYRVSR